MPTPRRAAAPAAPPLETTPPVPGTAEPAVPLEVDAALADVLQGALRSMGGEASPDSKVDEALGEDAPQALRLAARLVLAAKDDLPADALKRLAAATGMESPVRLVEHQVRAEAAPGIPLDPVYKADGRTHDLDGVPQAMRSQASAIWRAREQADLAVRRASDVEREMKRRDLVAYAKEKLAGLPGASADQLATLVLRAEGNALEATDAKLLRSVLEASAAAVKQSGLFNALGQPGGRPEGPGDELRRMAQKMSEDSGGKMTPQQAMKLVYRSEAGRKVNEDMRLRATGRA